MQRSMPWILVLALLAITPGAFLLDSIEAGHGPAANPAELDMSGDPPREEKGLADPAQAGFEEDDDDEEGEKDEPSSDPAPKKAGKKGPSSPAERMFPVSRETILRLLTRLLGRSPSTMRVDQAYKRALAIRKEAVNRALKAEQEAAQQVAALVQKEEKLKLDKARGSQMTMLRNLAMKWTDVSGFVANKAEFAKLFMRYASGPKIAGTDLEPTLRLRDGTTLVYPAGKFELKTRQLLPNRRFFPRDLLIQGAGMNETVLKLDEISTHAEIYGLTFMDLTIDCGDNYLTDLRVEPAIIRMVRCRVVGFDMGAGGSVMVSGRTVAFLAEDCRFETGYGRAPGMGNLFRARNGLLARLEGCTIVGPFHSIYEASPRSSQLFLNCTIEAMPEFTRRTIETRGPNVRFVNSPITYVPNEEALGRRKRKPLTDINPKWK